MSHHATNKIHKFFSKPNLKEARFLTHSLLIPVVVVVVVIVVVVVVVVDVDVVGLQS
jgi:hypothetical protein